VNVVEPSILGDVWNNRQMEVEAIVGNPVRMARENDVEAVKLEAIYILIKSLDEGASKGEKLGCFCEDETQKNFKLRWPALAH